MATRSKGNGLSGSLIGEDGPGTGLATGGFQPPGLLGNNGACTAKECTGRCLVL
jgi:hypothetical protein